MVDEVKEKIERDAKAGTCPLKRPMTKEEKKAQIENQKNGIKFLVYFFLAIVLLFIGVFFFIKILSTGPEVVDMYTYNGFTFSQVDGIWYSSGYRGNNLLEISLRHAPKELIDIPVKGDIGLFRESSNHYFITFDPRINPQPFISMSTVEIASNLRLHFGKDFTPACIIEHENCNSTGAPVVTCESAGENESVIFVNKVAEQSVVIDGNCAIISGEGEELVEAADRFLYGMYSIME